MNAVDRLFNYLEYKGIKTYTFEMAVGFSNGYLHNMKLKNSELKEGSLSRIIEYCPDLSPLWLVTGNGTMMRGMIDGDSVGRVPYYMLDFINGPDTYNNNNVCGYIEMPQFSTADMLVNVSGDSMRPIICSGDIVALKKIEGIDGILYGETYSVITDSYHAIRRIKKGSGTGKLLLVPENKEFESQDVDIEKITCIYRVLGIIKLTL